MVGVVEVAEIPRVRAYARERPAVSPRWHFSVHLSKSLEKPLLVMQAAAAAAAAAALCSRRK